MDKIISFFASIGDFFVAAGRFLMGLIEDLIYLVKLIADAVASIPSYLTWLPGEVSLCFLALIGIFVVLRIIGRD